MMNLKIKFLVLHLVAGLSSAQSCRIGDSRNFGCVPEKCISGQWVPDDANTILHDNCKRCIGWGDPHFEAFSGARFSWQVACNFALVQKGSSDVPEFGVFMDFKQIDHKGPAHVGPTIYQENVNTQIELNPDDLFNVKVNGRHQTISQDNPTLLPGTSVSAWKHSISHLLDDNHSSVCLRLYGQNHILVELCKSQISIWAPKHSSYPHQLGGLCGSPETTNTQLIARDGSKYPNPDEWRDGIPNLRFGNSWQTKGQSKRGCPHPLAGKRTRSLSEDLHMTCAYEANRTQGTHHDMCVSTHPGTANGISWDDHHDACKYDLCMVANGEGYKSAGFTVEMMLGHHREIHHREKYHKPKLMGIAHPGLPSPPGGISPSAPEITHPWLPSPPEGISPSAPEITHPWLPSPPEGISPSAPVIASPYGSIGPYGLIGHQVSFQQSHILPSQPEGLLPIAPVLVGQSGSILRDGTFIYQGSFINVRNDANLPEELSSIAPGYIGQHRPIGSTNINPRTRLIGNTNFQGSSQRPQRA